jgi:hypothetical protein
MDLASHRKEVPDNLKSYAGALFRMKLYATYISRYNCRGYLTTIRSARGDVRLTIRQEVETMDEIEVSPIRNSCKKLAIESRVNFVPSHVRDTLGR